jgi:hypothetical protein
MFNISLIAQEYARRNLDMLAGWERNGREGEQPVYQFPEDYAHPVRLASEVAARIVDQENGYTHKKYIAPKWLDLAQEMIGQTDRTDETLSACTQKRENRPNEMHQAGAHVPKNRTTAGAHVPKNWQTLIEEEDEDDEEDVISSLLALFAARKNDPAYHLDGQERRKVRDLLREGYSAVQIAAAIERAFDTRPTTAKPVRGFGFIVSHVHRHLRPTNSRDQPLPPSAEDSTEVLTEGTSPTGEPTGMTTETRAAVEADITHLQETSGDPLARVYTLLRAASIQGIEGVDDTHYDLPGIRLGLRRFLEMPDQYSGDELYDAVLAAVSRGIQPERLVGYVEAVLANRRSEHRKLEPATAHIARQHQSTSEARLDGLLSDEDSLGPEDATTRPTVDLRSRWETVSKELEMQMTKATFNTWLKPAQLLAWESTDQDHGPGSTRVVLGVPNGYVKDWLENRLLTPIQRTLHGIVGQPVEIAFQVDGTQEQMQ